MAGIAAVLHGERSQVLCCLGFRLRMERFTDFGFRIWGLQIPERILEQPVLLVQAMEHNISKASVLKKTSPPKSVESKPVNPSP